TRGARGMSRDEGGERMRRALSLSALVLLLVVGSPAHAQRTGPIFFGGGADPTHLIFVPIDTRQSVVPIAEPQTRSTAFKLLDLMPRISFPGAKPIIGQSTFPSPNQLPGANYLKAFRYGAIAPVGN